MAVTNVTSFGRSGLSDWVVQRVSGVVLTVYLLVIAGYLLLTPEVDFASWKELHSGLCIRLLTVFAVLSLAAHAWIGMWGVLTDYVTVRLMGPKATLLRVFLQLGMIAVIFVYVVWTVAILWGN
ncbi:succinate dehydrogenase, hydrophobic membrane anchor protein [Gammaproteobacteria bacterium 50_400_T64]|nr:succinate dehydrogenase, hydrophobic membrane anchor protein [Gammaproteobacteria bacterium 50_400_T64]